MSALYPVGGEFTIDGVSSDTWHCQITSWHAGLLPSLRLNAPDIPGRAGKANAGVEFSSRIVSADVAFLKMTTIRDDMEGLADALDPTGGVTHKFVLVDDMPHRYINVAPNADMPVAKEPAVATFTLSLEAFDPFWYLDTSQSIVWTATAASPITLPNIGTAPADPVFTITYPAGAAGVLTGIHITIAGVTVIYSGSIVAGDTLVIDCGAMNVTKNGVADNGNWSSDFPQVPKGGAQATYSDTNNVGAHIVVTYTERWK